MQQVVIVIPVYKEKLALEEMISMQQVYRILGKYPIRIIAPKRLKLYYNKMGYYNIVCFSDNYFESVKSYSHLLLTREFYEQFMEYEYMLVYQLDAFVFSDRLREFCQMHYDYIGAPWPKWMKNTQILGCRVGNGGLSLRNVHSALRVLNNKEAILASVSSFRRVFLDSEDVFWGYCGVSNAIDFEVPNVKTALSFAIEHDVRHCYKKLSYKDSFGCHNWVHLNYEIWKPIIESAGYVLPDRILEDTSVNIRKTLIRGYLWERFLRLEKKEEKKKIISHIIKNDRKYAIWGAGKDGLRCIALFKFNDIHIDFVYDRNVYKSSVLGYQIRVPALDDVKNYKGVVIVATKKYEKEIITYLEELGSKIGVDFLLFTDIEDDIIRLYYGHSLSISASTNFEK